MKGGGNIEVSIDLVTKVRLGTVSVFLCSSWYKSLMIFSLLFALLLLVICLAFPQLQEDGTGDVKLAADTYVVASPAGTTYIWGSVTRTQNTMIPDRLHAVVGVIYKQQKLSCAPHLNTNKMSSLFWFIWYPTCIDVHFSPDLSKLVERYVAGLLRN